MVGKAKNVVADIKDDYFSEVDSFLEGIGAAKETLWKFLSEQKTDNFTNVKKLLFQNVLKAGKEKKTLKDFIILNKVQDCTHLTEMLTYDSTVDAELMKLFVKYEVISYEELLSSKTQAEQHHSTLLKVLIEDRKITRNDLIIILSKEYGYNEIKELLKTPLARFILKHNIISPETLKKVLLNNNQLYDNRIYLLLVKEKLIDVTELPKKLAKELKMPYLSLNASQLSVDILNLVPLEIIRKYNVIPLMKEKGFLFCGLLNPFDVTSYSKIEQVTAEKIKPVIIDYIFFSKAVKKHPDYEKGLSRQVTVKEFLSGDISKLSIPEIVKKIIDTAVNSVATDIHIEPLEKDFRVRYRIDSMLHEFIRIPTKLFNPVVSRIKVMADLDISKTYVPQDGHITMLSNNEQSIDLRIATVPTLYGEKVVLRLVNQLRISGVDQLGLEPDEKERFDELLSKSQGTILVTGPVGSGKTTTLYTALNRLNVSSKNIMSIEDPVEYKLENINQIQVNMARDITFHAGLRAILRQDPNIIMVGEIRDTMTADVAIRAAMTGTLVLSTIHANSAVGTFSTLRHMGIANFLTANAIVGILAQRLVRKICPHCKEEKEISKDLIKKLNVNPEEHGILKHSFGRGCQFCFETGYIGRTGVFEVIDIDDRIKELIFNNESEAVLQRYVSEKRKIKNLKELALLKVKNGLTTPEEVHRVINF